STLVKRLWPTAWLQPKHGFKHGDWSMPDTRNIAIGKPFATDETSPNPDEERYFAVLALDGDEIGKWVSGLHGQMPTLGDQLSDYVDPADGKRKGARVYFETNQMAHLLSRKRPLTPSFHLQLSEMLANFGNFCVRRIVESHDGRLIYSGGDDVLALLPAHRAIPCAVALRAAFRGNPDILTQLEGAWRFEAGHWKKERLRLFNFDQPGFIRLDKDAPSAEGEPKRFFAIVPGPAADCSVGIAIAHFQHPLQEVVRAAHLAEKQAKSKLGRSAVALTLIKRSGETVHWGCKWDSGGLAAYEKMIQTITSDVLSNRFPHRLIELVEQYQVEDSGTLGGIEAEPEFKTVLLNVLKREIDVVTHRQQGKNYNPENASKVTNAILVYLQSLELKSPKDITTVVGDLIGLCKTVAFVCRSLPETHPEPGDEYSKSPTPPPATKELQQ
ncbi:MAG: type III-B CRISPR-associated protein Cas10/Cmr2, partial [Verrucomicrobiae bacterium]|nr:type III-B CRISPR-associated protein Cas10/Cmr2 [Verrucomicrobiae bacterium]